MATDTGAGLWRNRNWRLLFAGQAISILGDFVFDVTLVLWVATVIARDRSWAPLAVGGVLIAAAAPTLLVGPFAGVFVDRWDRRRTMLATDLIRAGLIASLLLVPVLDVRLSTAAQLTAVYATVALASASAQFFNPARFGLLGTVVAPEDRARSGGIAQATMAVASIIGPPLAAPLLFSVGVQWALVVDALSFVASFFAVRAIRIPREVPVASDPTERRFWGEFAEGARFVGRTRVLRVLLVCVVIATLGTGAINALDVFFVAENLHAPPEALGTLGAAFGAGSVLGAVIVAVLGRRIAPATTFWTMLTVTGLALLAYSRAPNLAIGLVTLLLVGIPVTMVNAVVGPILLQATPQRLLGRVMAVINPVAVVAGMLGMAVVTYLASTALRGLSVTVAGVHFGRIDAIFFVGGLVIVASGLWAGYGLRTAPAATAPVEPATTSSTAPAG